MLLLSENNEKKKTFKLTARYMTFAVFGTRVVSIALWEENVLSLKA